MPAKTSTTKKTGGSWKAKGGCATCGGMKGGRGVPQKGGKWAPQKGGSGVRQRGGAASDWVGSFYANTAVGGPAAISRATLEGITDAPMFNPLSSTATFPTNSTGIIPTGTYLAFSSGGVPSAAQLGGGKRQLLQAQLKQVKDKIARLERQKAQKAEKDAALAAQIAQMERSIQARQAALSAKKSSSARQRAQAPHARVEYLKQSDPYYQRRLAAYSNPAVWALTPPSIAQELWRQVVAGVVRPNVSNYTLPYANL